MLIDRAWQPPQIAVVQHLQRPHLRQPMDIGRGGNVAAKQVTLDRQPTPFSQAERPHIRLFGQRAGRLILKQGAVTHRDVEGQRCHIPPKPKGQRHANALRHGVRLDETLVDLTLLRGHLIRRVIQVVAVILGHHFQITGDDHSPRCVKREHGVRLEQVFSAGHGLSRQVLRLILVFEEVAELLFRLLVHAQPSVFHRIQQA